MLGAGGSLCHLPFTKAVGGAFFIFRAVGGYAVVGYVIVRGEWKYTSDFKSIQLFPTVRIITLKIFIVNNNRGKKILGNMNKGLVNG